MTASKFPLSMNWVRNDAHSTTRIFTSMPTSFSRCWMIWAAFKRSIVPLVGQDGEPERLARPLPGCRRCSVSFQPASASSCRARCGIIVEILDLSRIVGPGPRLVRAMGHLPHAEQHAMDDLFLVDGRGDGLPHPLVGEERMAQIVAEIGVGRSRIAVFVETRLEIRACRSGAGTGPG